jgi:hypothetical protein
VALLGDRKRQRPHRRLRRRLVVDVRRARADAEALQRRLDAVLVARAAQAIEQRVAVGVDVVQAAAVGDEQVQPLAAVDKLRRGAQRRRQLAQVTRDRGLRR